MKHNLNIKNLITLTDKQQTANKIMQHNLLQNLRKNGGKYV